MRINIIKAFSLLFIVLNCPSYAGGNDKEYLEFNKVARPAKMSERECVFRAKVFMSSCVYEEAGEPDLGQLYRRIAYMPGGLEDLKRYKARLKQRDDKAYLAAQEVRTLRREAHSDKERAAELNDSLVKSPDIRIAYEAKTYAFKNIASQRQELIDELADLGCADAAYQRIYRCFGHKEFLCDMGVLCADLRALRSTHEGIIADQLIVYGVHPQLEPVFWEWLLNVEEGRAVIKMLERMIELNQTDHEVSPHEVERVLSHITSKKYLVRDRIKRVDSKTKLWILMKSCLQGKDDTSSEQFSLSTEVNEIRRKFKELLEEDFSYDQALGLFNENLHLSFAELVKVFWAPTVDELRAQTSNREALPPLLAVFEKHLRGMKPDYDTLQITFNRLEKAMFTSRKAYLFAKFMRFLPMEAKRELEPLLVNPE